MLTDDEIREQVKDIAQCLGMALFFTFKCALNHALPTNMPEETDNLVEGWRNLANKICNLMEKA